jgi:hypothetical protein
MMRLVILKYFGDPRLGQSQCDIAFFLHLQSLHLHWLVFVQFDDNTEQRVAGQYIS